ncbi:hypothetical protein CSUI_005194, partial [Cystoisospora suis]
QLHHTPLSPRGTSPGPKRIAVKLKLGGGSSSQNKEESQPSASTPVEAPAATGDKGRGRETEGVNPRQQFEGSEAEEEREEEGEEQEGFPAHPDAGSSSPTSSSGGFVATGVKEGLRSLAGSHVRRGEEEEAQGSGDELMEGMRLLSGALKRAEGDLANHHPVETVESGTIGEGTRWKEREQKRRWENNGVLGEEDSSDRETDGVVRDKKRNKEGESAEVGQCESTTKKAKWTEEFMADMLSDSDEEETP